MEALDHYIQAGNTQPGGFYDGGSTARGGFAPNLDDSMGSPCSDKSINETAALYAAPARYAGTGQAAPFMGAETTKLYLNFVNKMVDEHTAVSREVGDIINKKQMPPAPAPPPVPSPPKEWKISDDMMHQKWGSVLRTLQPSATNNTNAPSAASQYRMPMKHAPAYLTGNAFNAAPPMSAAMRWNAPGATPLNARPALQ